MELTFWVIALYSLPNCNKFWDVLEVCPYLLRWSSFLFYSTLWQTIFLFVMYHYYKWLLISKWHNPLIYLVCDVITSRIATVVLFFIKKSLFYYYILAQNKVKLILWHNKLSCEGIFSIIKHVTPIYPICNVGSYNKFEKRTKYVALASFCSPILLRFSTSIAKETAWLSSLRNIASLFSIKSQTKTKY